MLVLLFLNACSGQEKTESGIYNGMLNFLLSDSVPAISVTDLHQVYEEVIILDTREKEEYSVSHIPGAIHVGYSDFSIDDLNDLAKEREIVVYCSVGYRSEKIGEHLKKAGFKHVRNLYGGIFEWINQDNLVVDKSGPVKNIHPYSPFWGMWINNSEIKKSYGESK